MPKCWELNRFEVIQRFAISDVNMPNARANGPETLI